MTAIKQLTNRQAKDKLKYPFLLATAQDLIMTTAIQLAKVDFLSTDNSTIITTHEPLEAYLFDRKDLPNKTVKRTIKAKVYDDHSITIHVSPMRKTL